MSLYSNSPPKVYASSLQVSPSMSANLLSIISGLNALGRIVIGVAGDRFGRIRALFFTMSISGISCLIIWTLAHNLAELFVFSVIFGFFCGAFFTMVVPITAEIVGKFILLSSSSQKFFFFSSILAEANPPVFCRYGKSLLGHLTDLYDCFGRSFCHLHRRCDPGRRCPGHLPRSHSKHRGSLYRWGGAPGDTLDHFAETEEGKGVVAISFANQKEFGKVVDAPKDYLFIKSVYIPSTPIFRQLLY